MSLYEYSIPDCLILGLLLGLFYAPLYEALRIIRLIFPLKAIVVVCDIAFFVAAAEGVFRLSLVLGNHIRGYTILGFAAGIFAYIVTLGRLLNAAENAAAGLWQSAIKKLARFVGGKIRKCFGVIAHNTSKAFGKVADFFGKVSKNRSRDLIFTQTMGYNKSDNNGGSVKRDVIRARVRKSP